MKPGVSRADIDMAKIPVARNIGGLIFTAGSMLVFLIGVPAIRFAFPAALAAGCVTALVLRLMRHESFFE